jgi:hypothetical protein
MDSILQPPEYIQKPFHLILMAATVALGIITLALGSYNYNNCNNATPVWMVAMGVTFVHASAFVLTRLQSYSAYRFQFTDALVLAFHTGIVFWGWALVVDLEKDHCQTDVYNYGYTIFIASIVVTAILWYAILSRVYIQVRNIRQMGPYSNSGASSVLWSVLTGGSAEQYGYQSGNMNQTVLSMMTNDNAQGFASNRVFPMNGILHKQLQAQPAPNMTPGYYAVNGQTISRPVYSQ